MSQGMEQENKETRTDIFPLLGKGVLLGIVDSGIDYENPDFRNADGTTRIAALWDQTVETGLPPAGYNVGTEFTSQQINAHFRQQGMKNVSVLFPAVISVVMELLWQELQQEMDEGVRADDTEVLHRKQNCLL